jgi:hypothetical protein
MKRDGAETAESLLARVLGEFLREGARVEIDGIGTFTRGADGRLSFQAHNQPRVFIAYVEEDLAAARRLFTALRARGFSPWLDKSKLLPGQNWPRAIEGAIETTDFFIACFSSRSVSKRGTFQGELRFALECARRAPLDEVFFIPVRLDACEVPARIRRAIQYVDLFPDWEAGLAKLERVVHNEMRRRRGNELRLVS